MEGGSLNSELHKYFNYDLNQITRSGFIKQRNKLKPDTMEHLFHKFHELANQSFIIAILPNCECKGTVYFCICKHF